MVICELWSELGYYFTTLLSGGDEFGLVRDGGAYCVTPF